MNIEEELKKAKEAAEKMRADAERKTREAAGIVEEKAEETVEEVKEEVKDEAKGLKDKVQDVLDKTDIDEKIVEGAKNIAGKIGSFFSGKKE